MPRSQNSPAVLTRSFRAASLAKANFAAFLLPFVLLLAACGTSTGNTPSATASSGSTVQTPVAPQQTTSAETSDSTATTVSGYPVKVYFSKFPDSLNNFNAVFPANRVSPTIAVATFSIQLLIAGPTLSERNSGYFSEFNSILTGPSSCSAPHPTGGPDFTLTLNMKGSKPSPGTATLRFCRASNSPGIGADARILAEINATLKQFSNIKNVVVLNQAGHCFGDESGQDRCLK